MKFCAAVVSPQGAGCSEGASIARLKYLIHINTSLANQALPSAFFFFIYIVYNIYIFLFFIYFT